MAYDEFLADRIRQQLKTRHVGFEEKNMMGGLAFMVDGKMCLGIIKGELMARIGPEFYNDALSLPGAREMDFTGRSMTGYVFVNGSGIDMESQLDLWVEKCIEFNRVAKAAKKRTAKKSK